MMAGSDIRYIATKLGYKIVTKALIISMLIYSALLIVLTPVLLKEELGEFHQFSNVVKEQKRTIYLLGLFSQSLLSHKASVINDIANKSNLPPDEILHDVVVYSLDESIPISQQELAVVSAAKMAADSMPELTQSLDYVIYFRSYDNKRVFANRRSSSFELKEDFFTSYCQLSRTCANYASSYSLSDRLLVSPIYKNKFDNRNVLTLSTPAYADGRIIGDIAVDIYLDQFGDLEHKVTEREDLRGTITSTIIGDNGLILGEYVYSDKYVVDNRNILIYKVSLFKFVEKYVGLFLIGWLVSLYIFYRLEELKLKKNHLKQVQTEVHRDELTGIYNRSILKQDVFITALKQNEIAIIAIDGDNLKKVNDIHGHHAGDAAIQHIANGMTATFRDSDFLVRTGGDEFVVFLTGCSLQTAEKLKNKLCSKISSTSFLNGSMTISVSAGVTVLKDDESIEEAVKRADALLYASKKS